jgi:hypothetical protein
MAEDRGHGKTIFVLYAAAYPCHTQPGGDEPKWYERLKKRDVAFAPDLQALDGVSARNEQAHVGPCGGRRDRQVASNEPEMLFQTGNGAPGRRGSARSNTAVMGVAKDGSCGWHWPGA